MSPNVRRYLQSVQSILAPLPFRSDCIHFVLVILQGGMRVRLQLGDMLIQRLEFLFEDRYIAGSLGRNRNVQWFDRDFLISRVGP